MKKLISTLLFILIILSGRAQNVAIGQWNEHLSYRRGVSVAEGNGKAYCATAGGIFLLNKVDNSTQRMSKVNGLSDIEATVLNFNKSNNKLLIAYKNSNMDIIDNSAIINIADIKNKPIIGNKSINGIYFIDQYAYLACGFGIVVLDMNRNEIKDTYYIGPGGNAINVRDITSDGTNIYAATDGGIYTALLSNPNLANYLNWRKFTSTDGLPDGIYNTIAAFNGKVYANYSKFLMSGTTGHDSIYVYNGTTWAGFPGLPAPTVYSMRVFNNNRLMIVDDGSIDVYDLSMTKVEHLYQYLSDFIAAKQGVIDSENHYWLADSRYGLVKCNDNYNSWNYYINGPASEHIYDLMSIDNEIWASPGSVDPTWTNVYQIDGMSAYTGDTWLIMKGNYPGRVNMDTVFDPLYLAHDPLNSNTVYASTWGHGVLEIDGKVPTKLYNSSNTPAFHDFLSVGHLNACKTSGIAFDSENSLWVCNPLNAFSALTYKKTDNTWHAIDLSAVIGNSPYLGQMLIDKNDQKWVILARDAGMMVYKGNSTPANESNCKKLTTAVGKGKLPSPSVYSMAEDADGQIWIGTDKGIAVFYNPENVFSGSNFDCQQILLTQDGNVQILLETEQVQAIAVDDANRKWIGTANSGVFLMSPDGTTQVQHFDMNNSPLFSNNVKCITINHKTGEVYFGTDKGLISYRSTATEGNEDFTDVYAFPNPVKHDYSGPIAIKGLVTNTTLKITDISGTLVYETKSQGGQAIWDAKNFNGERVSTGVYMVFCTNEDGSKKCVTKILVIN